MLNFQIIRKKWLATANSSLEMALTPQPLAPPPNRMGRSHRSCHGANTSVCVSSCQHRAASLTSPRHVLLWPGLSSQPWQAQAAGWAQAACWPKPCSPSFGSSLSCSRSGFIPSVHSYMENKLIYWPLRKCQASQPGWTAPSPSLLGISPAQQWHTG